jgi:hypothetical protein
VEAEQRNDCCREIASAPHAYKDCSMIEKERIIPALAIAFMLNMA